MRFPRKGRETVSDKLYRWACSLGIICALCGVLAGFGGWFWILVTGAYKGDDIFDSIGMRIFGGVGSVFFGGLIVGAAAAAIYGIRECWKP